MLCVSSDKFFSGVVLLLHNKLCHEFRVISEVSISKTHLTLRIKGI